MKRSCGGLSRLLSCCLACMDDTAAAWHQAVLDILNLQTCFVFRTKSWRQLAGEHVSAVAWPDILLPLLHVLASVLRSTKARLCTFQVVCASLLLGYTGLTNSCVSSSMAGSPA